MIKKKALNQYLKYYWFENLFYVGKIIRMEKNWVYIKILVDSDPNTISDWTGKEIRFKRSDLRDFKWISEEEVLTILL